MKKMRIGIVGCGAIGSYLARAIERKLSHQATVGALCDVVAQKAHNLSSQLKNRPSVLSLHELVRKTDFVIETASVAAVPVVLKEVFLKKRDVMILSVGGLLGREKVLQRAQKNGTRVYIPSGAVGGIDVLKAARVGKISQVELVTSKPSRGFVGAPHVLKNKIRLSRIKKDTVLFCGNAQKAVQAFPKNINVSALLAIAGLGPKRTRVKIVASPFLNCNVHEVRIEGEFGKYFERLENVPLSSNPKTSALAAFSALALLQRILSPFKVGT